MNREQLYQCIGDLDEDLLERSEKGAKKSRMRRWLAAAACMALLVLGAAETVDRLDYLRMGCSAWAGTLVDGVYYYNVAHSGVWRYTRQDGAKRIVSAWEEDGWQVNQYGVYYTQGRSLYVREHESGAKRRLYRAGFLESTHIGFSLEADGNVVVKVYHKRKEQVYELLLDGVTGEKLGTVTEKTSYGGDELLYSQAFVQVGDRRLTLVKEEGHYCYDLLENGASLLPEGRRVKGKNWFRYGGKSLFVPFWEENDSASASFLVLRPDGNDGILETWGRPIQTGTDDFLFYVIGTDSGLNSLWCLEVATGESWQVEKDDSIVIYDMVTDGEWMFTCVPWSGEHVCWRLIYDESGRPAALELVSRDIGEE